MEPRFYKWGELAGIPEEDREAVFDMSIITAGELMDKIRTRVQRKLEREDLNEDYEDAVCHLTTQLMASWFAEDMAYGWGWEENETDVAAEAMLDCLELHLDHLKSARLRRRGKQ